MKTTTMDDAVRAGANVILRGHARTHAPGTTAFKIERGHAGLTFPTHYPGEYRSWPVFHDANHGTDCWRPTGARYPTYIRHDELVTVLD